MATEIKMPQLSDTMSSGKILSWRKREGDSVKRGEILAEVETDKANLEIEAFHEGALLKILAAAGNTANVGDVIAVIGQPGETFTAISPSPVQSSPRQEAQSTGMASPSNIATTSTAPPAHSGNHIEHSTNGDRIKASPLARKIAQERNIELGALHGSGPSGRIVRKDVEQAVSRPSISSRPAESTATPSASGSLTPLSKMRDTIARRMQESVREAPHFYVTISANMREAQKLREVLKLDPDYKGISINHLIMKACAYALKHEPSVNRAIKDGMLYEPGRINIGIITAIEDGLLIPVVKDVDKISLRDVVFEARAAVERARAGRPSSTDLSGGTFSISNMGMYDIDNFTAIISPGQGAVLAVSSVKEEAIVENGQIVVGLRMKATLSVDHRVIDGVMAGKFLGFFKQAIEVPALLMV